MSVVEIPECEYVFTDKQLYRFFKSYDESENGCWDWRGIKNAHGYGRFWATPRMFSAHRVSFFLHSGPIPAGLHLDHLCRNTSCVNPAHLEPVTGRVNAVRGAKVRVTACPYGHPYDESNTGLYKNWRGNPSRFCKECRRVRRNIGGTK